MTRYSQRSDPVSNHLRMGAKNFTQMLKILPLLLLLNPSAFAQNTWNGLRFGMSENEVRAAYPRSSSFSKPLSSLSRGEYPADPGPGGFFLTDVDQRLEGMRAKATLSFDKETQSLSRIALSVEDPFAADRDPSHKAGVSLGTIRRVEDRLTEKYGRSVSDEGECDLSIYGKTDRPRAFSCNRLFRHDGQSIRLKWFFLYGGLNLLQLTYTPPPKGI